MAPTARLLPILVAASLLTATTALAASLSVTSSKLTRFTKTYGSPVTCTLSAVADAYVSENQSSTNFGSSTSLLVGPRPGSRTRTFIRFNVSNCSPAIPASAIVQSATLRLTLNAGATSTRTWQLRTASASWVESTITWNNQPGASGSVTSSTTVNSGTSSGTVVQWNAISDVQSFVTGAATNNGWRLADSADPPGAVASGLSFSSREAASGQPQLVIVYVS